MKARKLHFSTLAWMVLGSLGPGLAVNACGSDDRGDGPNGGAGAGSGTSGTGGGGNGGDGQGGTGMVVCDEPGGAIPPLYLAEVASGFDRPVFVTSEPTDASRLYVLEQPGLIWIVENGVVLNEPFLDATALVDQPTFEGAEIGLLGLAFHPNYEQNGRFFIYHNQDVPMGVDNIAIAEYRRSASNRDTADPGSRTVLLTIDPTPERPLYGNHNGGALAFGPDGYLYAGVGDGGDADDPHNNGQNLSTRLGKILRLDVDNPQTPPPGNLPGGDPYIWDYGLRNPWRISFDRCTGDLYIGDVGQNEFEEIDVEPAGQGHHNYGWSVMEGSACFKPAQAPGCDDPSLVPPVVEYSHPSGDGCSVNGGYVYRGNAIPALRGTYLYSDYCSNRIWTLIWKDGALMSQGELTQDLQSDGGNVEALVSFGEDAAGELYVIDLGAFGSANGVVYRIEPE